jgi:hypothetical protein
MFYILQKPCGKRQREQNPAEICFLAPLAD